MRGGGRVEGRGERGEERGEKQRCRGLYGGYIGAYPHGVAVERRVRADGARHIRANLWGEPSGERGHKGEIGCVTAARKM